MGEHGHGDIEFAIDHVGRPKAIHEEGELLGEELLDRPAASREYLSQTETVHVQPPTASLRAEGRRLRARSASRVQRRRMMTKKIQAASRRANLAMVENRESNASERIAGSRLCEKSRGSVAAPLLPASRSRASACGSMAKWGS